MKYCTHCGKKINDNSTFCPYCGARQPVSEPHNVQMNPEPVKPTRSSAKKWIYISLGSVGLNILLYVYMICKISAMNAYLVLLTVRHMSLLMLCLMVVNIAVSSMTLMQSNHYKISKSAGIVSLIGTLVALYALLQSLNILDFGIPLDPVYELSTILFIYSLIRYLFNLKKV